MKQPNNRPQKILGVWAAAISVAGALHAQPAGLWNFDAGDLSATVGSPLVYASSSAGTSFGTTTSFTIPDIGGTPANVMKFDAGASSGGYRMPVAVAANGGGGFVNNYTVLMDVLFPAASATVRRPLLETDLGLVNTTEGAEFYVSDTGELSGVGNARGTIAADTWYRIGIVVEGGNNQVRLYLNGVEQGSFPAGGLDGRLALNPAGSSDPFAELFKDLAGATALGYVNSVQFRGEALTKGQMQALAGPTASGIPETIPDIPSFVERWVPSEPLARLSTGLGVVLNPGSSDLSNISMTLNGGALTTGTTTDGDGNTVVTATGFAPLTALTDYSLVVTYTDSKAGLKSFTHDFYVPLLYEDFELVTLGSPVEEPGLVGNPIWANKAFTHTPPSYPIVGDWTVDRTGVPGYDVAGNGADISNDGRTEWAGWSFASKEFWLASDTQGREGFAKGRGNLAIADPDEWDDGPHAPSAENGWYKTYLTTPQISLAGAAAGTVFVQFDSSWSPEFDTDYHQTARLRYRFDSGAWQNLFIWESDSTSPNYKAEATSETVSIPLQNPGGATTVQLEFGMYDAGNDWWWAVDNIIVDAGAIPVSFTQQPTLSNGYEAITIGESATITAAVDGTAPYSYQWYKDDGSGRVAIAGATSASLTLNPILAGDTGTYSVDVTNPAGTVSSNGKYVIAVAPVTPSGDVVGQWDFNSGNLSATVGADLVYLDGPGGTTATGTQFATSTSLTLPDIEGQPANVMAFPALNGQVGYIASLGGPNGGAGATKKNQYTLIFDVLWPTAADKQWRTFVQIDSLRNGNDGEFFLRPTNPDNGIGVGATGYHGAGVFTPDVWHRVAIVVDQSAAVNRVSYYIDGNLVGSGAGAGFDGRFGIAKAVNFFSDNDGDARAGFVNSLQVRNVPITALEAKALGGPKAAGIPLVIDTSLAAPVIVSQPVGVFLSPGGAFTLSVGIQSSVAVTYQWYKGGVAINGATGSSLTINNSLTDDGGSYTVEVTNANGSVTSTAAVVSFPSSISQDLVAHLTFDDVLSDSSGRGNNGTAVGTIGYAAGQVGNALSYSSAKDGTSFNFVTLGTPADLNFGTGTDFTVTFWARFGPNGWEGDPSFISNKDWGGGSNAGWILATGSNGRIQWNTGSGSARSDYDSPGGIFSDAAWHHIAMVVIRGGNISTYVDGSLVDSRAHSSFNLNTPAGNATNIGQDGKGTYTDGGSVGVTEGYIDDVGIWLRRLTPTEVASIYHKGVSGGNLQTATGVTLGTVTTTPVSGGTSLQFDWRGQPGAKLQSTIDVANGPWLDVPGSEGASSIVVPLGIDNKYFRLILP